MIVKNHEADRFVTSPPEALQAALVFGPDAGLVQERAEKLLKTVVADLTDPFNSIDLNEKALLDDPARLFDEAAAISMMGGRRVIRVRGGGNDLADLMLSFLEEHAGDALLVIEAGDLNKSSALRKLFEGDETAAAIPCYADSARDLGDVVRDELRAQGFALAPGALEEAVSRLGSDRGVTRRELEKLALYAHGATQITPQDVREVMGDEAQARSESVFDAAASGNYARLDLELERLWIADIAPAQVIRGALGHFQRLMLAQEGQARGDTIDAVMRKFFPPIHYSRADSFKAQARAWNGERLKDALDMLLDAEAQTRTTGLPAHAVTGRALLSVAALAKARS
jgi:DNA polymerase III subunit delta